MDGPVPHVLIVGGGREVPGRLRTEGARTTTICRQTVLDSVQDAQANESVHALPDASPVDLWVDLAAVLHRHDEFTAVASFSELDQDKAAAVGRALRLPWHPPETVAAVHDKLRMRTVLAEKSVDSVYAEGVSCAEDVVAAGAKVGWPVVLKPVSGWASAGVSVLPGPQGAQAAIDRALAADVHQGHALMVEEYLAGQEYSVEALSEHGAHLVAAITEYESDPRTRVEVAHLVPAELSEDLADNIARFVSAALTALGVRNGLSHSEVMVMPDGGIHMIETHLRPAGGQIPTLVLDALGVDLIGAAVRQALGHDVLAATQEQLSRPSSRYAAIRFLTPDVHGRLVQVEGVAAAEGMPGVREVRVHLREGDEVSPVQNSFGYAGHVRTLSDRAGAAHRQALEAAAAIDFVVRPRSTGDDATDRSVRSATLLRPEPGRATTAPRE